jgi:hypothetical protein
METSLGALWGEDPRYMHAAGRPFKSRMANVLKLTFVAYNREGEIMPAYARYIALPANSFMTNTWRPDSHGDTRHALFRVPLGFLNRLAGNAFAEFWPDVQRRFGR